MLKSFQVAAYTGETKAILEYDHALAKAEVSGIKSGLASGFGLGFALMILFSSYGLAMWYGSILVRKVSCQNPKKIVKSFKS